MMRLTVVFIFLFWGVSSFAQTYPVHVQVNVSPPYSFYLSDYVSGSRERVSVTLLNRDVQYSSMPVRLRIMVKGNGYRLQSLPYASVAPLILEPNVPYRLSMEELRPYFDPHNLSGQGLGASGYLKGSRLPEGPVEFSVEVLEYQTNRLLSRAGSAMIFLSLQKPPQLGLPFDGAILAWQEPLHFQFQWTPRHSGVARVEYELVIKELWDTGMDPSSAFSFAPEIFRERVVSTSYTYGPMCPPLEPGHVYAWCVRVVAKDGIDDVRVFENDGLSVIRTFRIGSYCPSPLSLQLLPDRGNLEVSWESAPEHREYRVTYRLKDASNWHEQRAYSSPCQLFGVRSGQTYECKVDGVCEDGTVSSTLVQTVTLPSEDTSRQRNCGVLPPVDLSNTTPLEELYEGDLFWAGDFPVQVTSSSGRAGIFSGEGNVVVPYLLFHRFAVRFDNVFLNSERRLVRGFVEAVYDETDGSIGNLDDIFEGGSSTGEVVSGITYADIDVSFTLPGDGSYSYDSVSSQIHVYDGDDEVGVIDVGGILSSSGEGGSSVSGESVFPLTVKDSAGNLYSLAPDPDAPSGSSGGVALKVRKVGSSGGALPDGSIVYDRLDRDIGVVSFRDAEGSRYEFDCWHPSYGSALLIRDKYERLDGDYYVPCKLLPSGASDRVVAHLDVHGSGVDPAKVRFVTRGGTEYTPESFDGESGDYVLSLVGGRENDGQELYALYPKPDSGYYNLGKLLVLSYPSYRFSVKVVSVGGGLPSGEFSGIRDYLSGFFSRYGIRCDVSYDETEYSDLELFDKGSGILSAYNSRMKSFQRHYAETRTLDESCSYLFIFPRSGHKGKRDFSGFMPRGCQFGYVFREDFSSFNAFCIAAVHELCHGRLSLKHTFDASYGLKQKSTDNLMDYTEGATHLGKWQWDLIHDPGVVVRIFERDKDGALATGDGFSRLVTLMQEAGASGCAFIQRCEAPVTYLRDGEIKLSYQGRYYRCVVGNYRDGMISPKQSPDGGNVWKIDEQWLKQFFTDLGDAQNIVLYEKAGTTKTCTASEDYSDFAALSDPWKSESFLSRWASDLSRCMASGNAFESDRIYTLESVSFSDIDIIDQELGELVRNPLFRHLRFQVSLTTVSGRHSTYSSFSGGDADLSLKYLIDESTRQVHVKLEFNESLFSSSLSSSLNSRASEYGISGEALRQESMEAMRLLKEDILGSEDGFLSGLRQLICGIAKKAQVCGNVGKSIWETGEIPKGLWLISDNGYSYYKDNSFTLGQIPAGISDGIVGEVFGLPLMIKTVGEIIIDKEKRSAFGQLFSWDGLEAMWEGLKEEYAGSWNDANRRQYIVSKTTIDIAALFTGGGLVGKGGKVAKASDNGKALIQEGIGRFTKEVPGPKALKGLTGEALNQRKALLGNLNKKLSNEQIEKALHFVPLEDVEDFLNLLNRLKDNRTLDRVLPQLGEFYNKDKGARFVLKYAGSFPPEVINTIRFEDMVKIFDEFGNETKRVYDFVIKEKKYELKAWTRWAHWSDEAFLNQFVKDIASIDKLGNLQWVFMKTENITEESLHKYIIRTLKSQKGRNELIRYLKLEQTKALFGFPPKIEDSNELVENIIKHFENKEKFYTLFKVVE